MPDFFSDLNAYRADLEGSGLLAHPAWQTASIWAHLDIDLDGNFVAYAALTRKEYYRTDIPVLPRRTRGPVAAFLTGQAEYWAGSKRAYQADLHRRVLAETDDPAARAVLAFFSNAPPDLPSDPGFVLLRIAGVPAPEIPALRDAWERYFAPPADLNPSILMSSRYPFLKLGTRTNADSATSYGGNEDLLTLLDPAGAAEALNYLLARPTTARHEDTAVIAWMAGDPLSDPTPLVIPFYGPSAFEDVAITPINTLHVAIIDAVPPARISLRWYWSGSAADALARFDRFNARLRATYPDYFVNERVRWHGAFRDTPRWPVMVMAILQSVLCGDPMPTGVMGELVRLHRKPRQLPSAPLSAALLEIWAEDHGHIARQGDT